MLKFASALVLVAVAEAGKPKDEEPVYYALAPQTLGDTWGGNSYSVAPGQLGNTWGGNSYSVAPGQLGGWGGNYGRRPQSYNNWGGYNQYNYDPWGNNTEEEKEDRSGWYSQWQQYSPPQIAYKPAFTKSTTYAECRIRGDEGETDFLFEFGQFSGKPASLRANSDNDLAGQSFKLRITEYSAESNDGEYCVDMGEEWRPLQEYDRWHQPNRY